MRYLDFDNVRAVAQACNAYVDTPICSKEGKYRMLKSDVMWKLSDGTTLTIEAGMWWDENSIPWALQWAFPKSGIYAVPALIHDALYFDTTTSQKFADNEFRMIMEAMHIKPSQVKFRFLAVRLFGGIYWRKNLKNPGSLTIHNRKFITIK